MCVSSALSARPSSLLRDKTRSFIISELLAPAAAAVFFILWHYLKILQSRVHQLDLKFIPSWRDRRIFAMQLNASPALI